MRFIIQVRRLGAKDIEPQRTQRKWKAVMEFAKRTELRIRRNGERGKILTL